MNDNEPVIRRLVHELRDASPDAFAGANVYEGVDITAVLDELETARRHTKRELDSETITAAIRRHSRRDYPLI